MSNESIHAKLASIQARNKRVEADKAWETSWTRKIIILILTYAVVVTFFYIADLPDPFANAAVPSLAFVVSTLVMPVFKKLWMKVIYKK